MAEAETQNSGTNGAAIQAAAGEVKRKRGRPPGTKNKPKEAAPAAEAPKPEVIRAGLAAVVSALFALGAVVAGFFAYDCEKLTEEEAAEGARYFAPLAARAPWLLTLTTYIGGPLWAVSTFRAKLRKRAEAPAAGGNDRTPSSTVAPLPGVPAAGASA